MKLKNEIQVNNDADELTNAKQEAFDLTYQWHHLSSALKNTEYGRELYKRMQDAKKRVEELEKQK